MLKVINDLVRIEITRVNVFAFLSPLQIKQIRVDVFIIEPSSVQ